MTRVLLPQSIDRKDGFVLALDRVKIVTTMAQGAADVDIARAPPTDRELLAQAMVTSHLLRACQQAVQDIDKALDATTRQGLDSQGVVGQLADKLDARFAFLVRLISPPLWTCLQLTIH